MIKCIIYDLIDIDIALESWHSFNEFHSLYGKKKKKCHILYLFFSVCSSLKQICAPFFCSPSYATGIMHKYILMLPSNSTISNYVLFCDLWTV